MVSQFYRFAVALLIVAFFFGCTPTPRPATYRYTSQQKMQAAAHWDILADDVAKQIKIGMMKSNSATRPVFVEPACGAPDSPCGIHEETPFGQGFHDMLLTQLVNKYNVTVLAEIEENAMVVNTKAQVLYHVRDRSTRHFAPGFMTAMATVISGSVLVIRDAWEYGGYAQKSAAVTGTALAGVAFIDAVSGMYTELPHSEVIITTSIKDNNTYLMRKTDIYYINDEDYWHYDPPSPARAIEVTGS